jgi:rubrerythrin
VTKTTQNLQKMIDYESQARTRYDFFAQQARKQGFHYIAKILEETAENEKYHCIQAYKLLSKYENTDSNIQTAIEGENYECKSMYPSFAEQAKKDGTLKAEILFNQITKIEKHHRDRFLKILNLLESGKVYKRDSPIKWKCSICGYTYEGIEPPNRCPYCQKPKEYYEPANLDV